MPVRRYVFPVLWLVIFAVIAAALFKLAFINGLKAEAAAGGEQPGAQISTPLVPAVLGTVTNLVQVQGSVVSDPTVNVKSTSDGTVDFLYVQPGDTVIAGAPLFQVKTLLEPEMQTAPTVRQEPSDSGELPPTPAPVPVYTYTDVLATADGTVEQLSVLLKQQVAVGADVASLDPGTFSVSGTLTSDQQFRILGRANTAMVTVNGGPAPFPCSNVSMGKSPAAETGISTQAQIAGPGQPAAPEAPAAGSVSCSVPADIPVFSGLGAAIDITAGQAEDVVTVPTTAVQGSVQTGIVWVMPGGPAAPQGPGPEGLEGEAAAAGPGTAAGAGTGEEAVEREVSLGLNDGQTVEIISGLAEGEMVLQFVPGAPALDQQMNGMPGVMGG
ncbi:efflux RND transporter periplasmic adaptor subunit [Arthrobacter citreus]|uniref:efflux RND transporter periplasmic adaptor subunit n=1 Tax=Arthrobacter TaxID=1663 RepID=UPI001264E359|nr:efflux RND transporter periplasmic adaptor subunit [Arthrobacter gandavensis]